MSTQYNTLPASHVWDFKEPMKIGLVPDMHVKPGQDLTPLVNIGKWFVKEEVDLIVAIGDWADSPSLSSYDKNTKSIEGKRIINDLKHCKMTLDVFNEVIEPLGDIPCLMTEGNHESPRLERLYNEHPQLDGLAGPDPFGFEGAGWWLYQYQDIIRVNGIAFSHCFKNNFSLLGSGAGGTADNRMKTVGFPHVQGHQHGNLVHGSGYRGDGSANSVLVMGAAFEGFSGYQGRGVEFYRGAAILDNTFNAEYDLQLRTLKSMLREFGPADMGMGYDY